MSSFIENDFRAINGINLEDERIVVELKGLRSDNL